MKVTVKPGSDEALGDVCAVKLLRLIERLEAKLRAREAANDSPPKE